MRSMPADNDIGLSGIIAAQRYLDVHPNDDIIILEKDEDIGGVFSRSQYASSRLHHCRIAKSR